MDFATAFNKASALCARQECCCSDIAEKLTKWGASPELSEKVTAQLLSEKYIDEERFAGFYTRDKFRFNRWGKQKIIWQLRQKKIAEHNIQSAIESIDDNDYAETLRLLLNDKARSIGEKDRTKKQAALIRFAASRGFEISAAMPIVTRLCNNNNA